ncbi:MAG: methyltransferase, TIGR04325 family [Chitinophagaceae bacterium]
MKVNLAPIVLFVYNRPDHTQQTLEALFNNELASQSILYVFADGPKENATIEDVNKINQTRSIVKNKEWCKAVIVVEKEENEGLANSIIAGVTKIINHFGKIIVLEDDIVTGKGFLKYMNEALNLYEDDERVISIHGYNYPIKFNGSNETYFLKGADCWGWATWSRGWSLFELDAESLYNQIGEKNLNYTFDFDGAYPYTAMLKNQMEKKVDSWAIRWYASAFLKNKYTLYPRVSLVKNIGLDGSGTHGKSNGILFPSLVDYCRVKRIPVVHNKKAVKLIKKLYVTDQKKHFLNTIRSGFGSYNRYAVKLLPPLLLSGLRYILKRPVNNVVENLMWEGNFESWDEAKSFTRGYDQQVILEKVHSSLLKVKNGEAVYERDSVLFDKIQYSWPQLACLQNIALENNNTLHVIDLGGSLGSSYFQNRHFFNSLDSFKWTVVEQKHFVDAGKRDFEDASLQFEYSVEDALKKNRFHCLLLSNVLQYLPEPFTWISKFCSYNFDYVILDHTGLTSEQNNILTVQNVPVEIYDASYPCWFFNESEILKPFLQKYYLVADFNDSFTNPIKLNGADGYWKGFYLKKK